MVNEKAKNPAISTPDGTRGFSPMESIPHRGRKRSFSDISITTKGPLSQNMTKEELEAKRLLTKAALLQRPQIKRQSESARLLKLVPDLSQKEMSRLVAAIIRRQKREAPSTSASGRKATATREKPLARSLPALFPEKLTAPPRSERLKDSTPARSAALSKQDALRMLQEARTGFNRDACSEPQPESIDERTSHHHRDLAEELVHRVSPR